MKKKLLEDTTTNAAVLALDDYIKRYFYDKKVLSELQGKIQYYYVPSEKTLYAIFNKGWTLHDYIKAGDKILKMFKEANTPNGIPVHCICDFTKVNGMLPDNILATAFEMLHNGEIQTVNTSPHSYIFYKNNSFIYDFFIMTVTRVYNKMKPNNPMNVVKVDDFDDARTAIKYMDNFKIYDYEEVLKLVNNIKNNRKSLGGE